MSPTFPPQALLLVPLLAALIATAPWFAPVRRAFALRKPVLALQPGEILIAEIRPDRGVLAACALGVAGLMIGGALLGQWVLGAATAAAYLPLVPFGLAALAHLALQSRGGWRLTDRRILTALGAELPLADVTRIAVGALSLRLDGQGAQSVRLSGLADARRAARLVRDTLRHAHRR